ncbi:MAG: helix-turn-helix transcriptional regulator [Alphaproteobacteria bacterium]|nr:MAG: helix-turn-helix transcriptional regulator [Alphaproteobacteria bacterium]
MSIDGRRFVLISTTTLPQKIPCACYPTIPPRVDYALTEWGQTLIPPVVALWTWAHDHQAAIETTSCRAFDHDRNR